MDAEESDVRDKSVTSSRISMAALCTPNGSPRSSSKGHGSEENGMSKGSANGDEDVSMKEVENGKKDQTQSNAADGEALDEKNSDEEDDEGEGEEEEDDDEEEEEDDEDEDDDEDEEEAGSGSESGTFQSVSEMEGVQGDEGSKRETEESASLLGSSETGKASGEEAIASTSAVLVGEGEAAKDKAPEINTKEAPKRKRPPRRRSPSLDVSLPIAPPVRPTIRMKLTIAHSDESQYLTNVPQEIYKTLKEKKHPWADWYETTIPEIEDTEMTSGPSDGPDLSELGGLAKLLQKYPDKANGGGVKKKKVEEYDIGQYDVRDPFVDDSELGVDEPTHSAKPSADGFFVTQGEVELEKAIAAARDMKSNIALGQGGLGKKAPMPTGFGHSVEDGGGGAGEISVQIGPKDDHVAIVNVLLSQHAVEFGMISPAAEDDESRQTYFSPVPREKTPTASSSERVGNGTTEGSRQSPIKVDDDDDDSHKPVVAPTAKYPTRRVPKRLEQEFDMLRQKVAKESWLKKAKFPPDLRDPLMQASKIAIALNEYNDNFFNWLPHIFPYNRLTLHKYTKRQFVQDHIGFMQKLLDLNLKSLEAQIKEALPMLQQEYEEAKRKWNGGGVQGNNDGSSSINTNKNSNGQESQANEEGEEPGDQDGEVEGEEAEKGDEEMASKGEPVKRWRWTEPMREVLFTIITIDSAIVELRNEKAGLEGSEQKASFINARKLSYKKVHDLWPDGGWTTTTYISREYGLYKKKVEKFTLQHFQTLGRDPDFAISL